MKVRVTTESLEDQSKNDGCCGSVFLFLIIAVGSLLLFGSGLAGVIIVIAAIVLGVGFFGNLFSSREKRKTYLLKGGERQELKIDPNLERLNISIALQEELEDFASAKQKPPSRKVIEDVLHELKNPLSVIKGNLSLMKGRKE